MTAVREIFDGWRAAGRAGLMPFVTAGYPSLEVTAQTLAAFEQELGPTVVELGIPFSDPIADGPVIAASMHEALKAGATPGAVFEAVRRLRPDTRHALVAMVSMSIVTRLGPDRFVDEAAAAGFDGLIIPDLEVASGAAAADDERLRELAGQAGLGFTLLVSPTTPPDRAAAVVQRCLGWVYLLARVGITGERRELPDVSSAVRAIRDLTELPVAVGFGISSAEQVAAATAVADGAIVGSAVVRRMGEVRAGSAAAAAAGVVRTLAAGLRGVPVG